MHYLQNALNETCFDITLTPRCSVTQNAWKCLYKKTDFQGYYHFLFIYTILFIHFLTEEGNQNTNMHT